MLPDAHDLEAAPSTNDEDARAARPASRAVSSRSSSPPSYDEEQDDGVGDVQEPLLPRYRFAADRGKASVVEDEERRQRVRKLALLVGGTLVAVLLGVWTLRRTSARPATPAPATLHTPVRVTTDASRSLTEQFLSDPLSINDGVVPFSSSLYSPIYGPAPLPHTLTTSSFASSPSCLEHFVATGAVCPSLHDRWSDEASRPKVDIVWTWINGSSAELLGEWREAAALRGRQSRSERARRWVREAMELLRRRVGGASVMRHFREHDELRFSVRSVLASLPVSVLSTLHLVVGDTPAHSPSSSPSSESTNPSSPFDALSSRLAQIPRWVNLSSLEFGKASERRGGGEKPSLRLHPHSELFKTGATTDEATAALWHDTVLPSFNSLAIESQLANIPFASSTALYLNDDFFLRRPLALSDLTSPLSGPVFRMQRDLLVSGVSPENTHDDPEGEWRGLGYTAWLLDQRFGKRARPYLVHVAKTVSTPMLREVQQVFLKELTTTAEARFRGAGPAEVQTLFLLTHYTIEKHREALLWSFFVARSDPDGSGAYSPSEHRALLSSLGYDHDTPPDSPILAVPRPARRSLANLPAAHGQVGLPNPLETTLDFSSHDGYAFFGLEGSASIPALLSWPSFGAKELETSATVCTLDLAACFGADFLSPSSKRTCSVAETFRRVAYEHPQCGDCLIALLVGKSVAEGLEAFLPKAAHAHGGGVAAAEPELEVHVIGLEGTKWSEIDFGRGLEGTRGPLRQRAAALIHRYSYTLGSSPAAFESIRSGGTALSAKLAEIDAAFVALNDDVASSSAEVMRDVDARMGEWFEESWPRPSPWERVEG